MMSSAVHLYDQSDLEKLRQYAQWKPPESHLTLQQLSSGIDYDDIDEEEYRELALVRSSHASRGDLLAAEIAYSIIDEHFSPFFRYTRGFSDNFNQGVNQAILANLIGLTLPKRHQYEETAAEQQHYLADSFEAYISLIKTEVSYDAAYQALKPVVERWSFDYLAHYRPAEAFGRLWRTCLESEQVGQKPHIALRRTGKMNDYQKSIVRCTISLDQDCSLGATILGSAEASHFSVALDEAAGKALERLNQLALEATG